MAIAPIMAAVAIGGALVQGVSSIQQGNAQKQQYDTQAAEAQANAQAQAQQAAAQATAQAAQVQAESQAQATQTAEQAAVIKAQAGTTAQAQVDQATEQKTQDDIAAQDAQIQAEQDQAARLQNLSQTVGTIRASTASRGLSLSSPSAGAMEDAAETYTNRDITNARFNAFQTESNYRLAGDTAVDQGNKAASATLTYGNANAALGAQAAGNILQDGSMSENNIISAGNASSLNLTNYGTQASANLQATGSAAAAAGYTSAMGSLFKAASLGNSYFGTNNPLQPTPKNYGDY